MQCFFSIYSEKLDILLIINYCKYSIKPPKGLFLSIRFRGGGRGGGVIEKRGKFNLVVKQGAALLF